MSAVNNCARCEKSVYPTEELKCLDKIWHKGCFKCQVCGMTLNMRTYKGYDKLPYCNAHTPVAKHTTVADTPEGRRLAENTKIQSQVKYHEEFERNMKGKVTQVADDPELIRLKQTSKIVSNVEYHREVEKKQEMEYRRRLVIESEKPIDHKNSGDDGVALDQLNDVLAGINLSRRNSNRDIGYPSDPPPQSSCQRVQSQQPPVENEAHKQEDYSNNLLSGRSRISDPNSNLRPYASNVPSYSTESAVIPPSMSQKQNYTGLSSQFLCSHQVYGKLQHQPTLDAPSNADPQFYMSSNRPLGNVPGRYYTDSAARPIYKQQTYQHPRQNVRTSAAPASTQQQQHILQEMTIRAQRMMFSPANACNGAQRAPSSSNQPQFPSQQHHADRGPSRRVYTPQQKIMPNLQELQGNFQAIYDYTAQDHDEVSFFDGDLIKECIRVDEGWIIGRVSRTGLRGMIPANYVVPA